MSYVWGGILNGDIAELGVRDGFLSRATLYVVTLLWAGTGDVRGGVPLASAPSFLLTNLQEHNSAPYTKHMDTQTICQHIALQMIWGKPVA